MEETRNIPKPWVERLTTSRIKKITWLIPTACILMALGGPPIAQAIEFTDVNGNTVKVGSEITKTWKFTKQGSGGVVQCTATMHEEVLVNGPNYVLTDGPPPTITKCVLEVSGLTVPVTGTVLTMDDVLLSEGVGSSTTEFVFDIPSVGIFNCHLEGELSLQYEPESDEISVPGSSLTDPGGSGVGCPTGAVVSGVSTIENALGKVTIDP